MFSSVRNVEKNALFLRRLAAIELQLRQLRVSVEAEAQAEVFSALNKVLALGNKMSPLRAVLRETPAEISDVSGNLDILSEDVKGIAAELERLEMETARVFNLAASSQNSLRQQIREAIYSSNQRRYVEGFLNLHGLDKASVSLDFEAAVATLPLLGEESVLPTRVQLGPASVGKAETTSDRLFDGLDTTSFVWNGSKLELQLDFNEPEILNRLYITPDDYEGLILEGLTASSDGASFDNILAELRPDQKIIDASSGKFSGNHILDFAPRHVRSLRLVLSDRLGEERIALRGLKLARRRYATAGSVQSKAIDNLTGTVRLDAVLSVYGSFTAVAHQLSYDGVHFENIALATPFALTSSPFWYRAVLQRREDLLAEAGQPLTTDPASSGDYVLASTQTVELNGGVLERTLVFDTVQGPVVFGEDPLPGTLRVWEGATLLSLTAYTFSNRTLAFPSPKSNVRVLYQTSEFGAAGLLDRQPFFSPYLYEFRFTKV